MKRLLLAVALATATAVAVLPSSGALASGESPVGYLHNLAAPPLCAFPWETPDPSLSVCQARFFAPRLALTSQSVLLRIGDNESSQADCAAVAAAQTTEFTVDGESVPVTTQPCRYVPLSVDNLDFIAVWHTDYRHLITAGSLAAGVHTLTWTATFNSDVSYSLGCTDPSGRCTIPAGTVVTATATVTITD